MKKLKPVDIKLLLELMKNAKRSDRKLAKILGVSQPTVTRKRAMLEKEVIEGYTAIPNWEKIGYKILAIILVKTPLRFAAGPKAKEAYEKSIEWLNKQPNVILGGTCRGLGMSGVMISLHRNYAEFDDFLNRHKRQLGELLEDVQPVLLNLSGEGVYRPLHLKYLAETE